MLARPFSQRTDAEVVAIAGASRCGSGPGLPRRLSLVLALALVVVIAGLGGSAFAAVTGLGRVHAESPSSSSSFRAVTASCPAGKQVLGGGAGLIGGESQVALNDVIPNETLTGVTAEAFEDQTGYPGSWSLRAYAICATPPPGLERVRATSPTDSLNKTVTATCPAGKRLLGAGGGIAGGAGEVVVEDIRVTSLTTVTAEGVEDQDGTASDWFLRAFAICANPVHLLERVVATSPTDSLKAKSVTATCPTGKQVVGGGGELGGGRGQVVLGNLMPNSPLDNVTVHGVEDEDGTARNWFVRAFAICAAASHRVVATSPPDSEPFKAVFADCPSVLEATGGGADITGGGGQVRIDGAFPVDDPEPGPRGSTGFSADALEDDNGYANPWFIRAYAICATPLPGLESILDFSSSDSSSTKSVTATCPAGTRVVGAGGGILSVGDPTPQEVVLDDLTPNAGLTNVTATGYEDETGDAGDWGLFATPICASPPPGLEMVSATSPLSSSNKSATATCPSGKNLLGTGAQMDGGLGQVVLDDLTPNAALTTVTVTGLEDETGHAGVWSVRAFAICANP